MNVFLVGGTGVIGRHAVPLLVEAGHQVTAVARSPGKAEQLAARGATPVVMDPWDGARLQAALADHDAVVNLATSIPPAGRALVPWAWRENDRICRHLSRILVDATLAAGVPRLVQESLAFTYADGGDQWLDEHAPVDARDQTATALEAEAQCARVGEAGGTGVVLRFGLFMDPPTMGRDILDFARRGRLPFPGSPDAFIPLLHPADAGSAAVAAMEAPGGTYNIVENDPAPRGQHASTLSDLLDRKLRLPPPILARLPRLRMLARSQRVSNRRFREVSSWSPSWSSDRAGWAEVLEMAREVGAS